MPYSCSIEELLACMREKCPDECEELLVEKNHVEHGLLSVGLKLHLLNVSPAFWQLIGALGGSKTFSGNMYRKSAASVCLVFPPVGNARVAIRLLECIGKYTDSEIFGNPYIQLQVCSPGRLDQKRAALLAMAFYLSSDTLRRYTLEQFLTTASFDDRYKRGRRLVIYDAEYLGGFERNFAWWKRSQQHGRVIRPELPFKKAARTDIIVGACSRRDIENINLAATLLVHARFKQHRGYWRNLGASFQNDVERMLEKHLLGGLLEAPWVHPGGALDMEGDREFFAALQELTAYAFEDAERTAKYQRSSRFSHMWSTLKPGILDDARSLLEDYRTVLVAQSEAPAEGDTA